MEDSHCHCSFTTLKGCLYDLTWCKEAISWQGSWSSVYMKWGQAAKLGRKSCTSALLIQLFCATWHLCWQGQQTWQRLNRKQRTNYILILDQHKRMKASSLLDCINRTAARRLEEVITQLYSASLWPYLQFWVQFWTLPRHQWTWVHSLKGLQDVQGLERLPWKERLREQGLFSLEKRWR